jgi:hypothetical protein
MLFINVLLMLDIHFWFCTSLVWYLPPLLLCRCGRSFKLQPQVQVYSSLFLRSSFFKVYFYFLSVVCLYFLGFFVVVYILYVNYVSCLFVCRVGFSYFCNFFPNYYIFQITNFLYDGEKKQVICHYKCLQFLGFDFHSLDTKLK